MEPFSAANLPIMEPFQEPCIINARTLNGPLKAGALG